MPLFAAAQKPTSKGIACLLDSTRYAVETSATFSDGSFAPFWLASNRHGLSSLEPNSAYLRAGIFRSYEADSLRKWKVGYGIDLVVSHNHTADFFIQQLYADFRFKHTVLTVGAKEWPMELKNNQLSSGSQTFGINAHPIPQLRLSTDGYSTIPYTRKWLHFKGYIAYGAFTDDIWQHRFTHKQSRYADQVLYHGKAGYLLIDHPERDNPLSAELGLEMATQFGGTTHRPNAQGVMAGTPNSRGFEAFWHALIPGGSDPNEESYNYSNMEGNHVGSWVARINYDQPAWRLSLYIDHFFEDHSGMFLLDFDGYGQGDAWNKRIRKRYMMYQLKDNMLGAELVFKRGTWVRNILCEYLYTKYQSGPIYHDHTQNISDHVGGVDNYYNHLFFPGWQHWGMVAGNPLYRSPLYNRDGLLCVENNRFIAYHFGLSGAPCPAVSYRILATWQEGWGSYDLPFRQRETQTSLLAEALIRPQTPSLAGWSLQVGFGLDRGKIVGNNLGASLTLRKTGIIR